MIFAESSEVVPIINAIGTIILAAIGAYLGYLQWKQKQQGDRTEEKVDTSIVKTDAVHTIVNNQRTVMEAKIKSLEDLVRRMIGERTDADNHAEIEKAANAARGVLATAAETARELKDQPVRLPQRSSIPPITRPATGEGP